MGWDNLVDLCLNYIMQGQFPEMTAIAERTQVQLRCEKNYYILFHEFIVRADLFVHFFNGF